MAIFITGDIHASYDIAKLTETQFDATGLTKDDYVVICGDFGLVWDDTASERYWLRWLDARPFTTLFVDGNHEGFARLETLPVETWKGGRVHRVGQSILHLMRGELFDIDGVKLFAMGGAASSSYDKEHREEGVSWFPEEIPSQQEREHALETLEAADWRCDVVITHCAPTSAAEGISRCTDRLALHPMDEYTDWLQSVRECLDYRQWFCGHYHFDAEIDEKLAVLYNRIVKLNDGNDAGQEDGEGREDGEDGAKRPYTWCEPFAGAETDGNAEAALDADEFELDLD